MAVYLVDFENVSSAGISGIQKLTKDDKVYIFYTVNASNMSFAAHLNLLSSPAEVVYYNVASGGKNALDFQLASFLGYLICQGKEKKFCIISNDRGFEYVKTFWERNGVAADISIFGAPSINRSLLVAEKPFATRIQQNASAPVLQETPEDKAVLAEKSAVEKPAEVVSEDVEAAESEQTAEKPAPKKRGRPKNTTKQSAEIAEKNKKSDEKSETVKKEPKKQSAKQKDKSEKQSQKAAEKLHPEKQKSVQKQQESSKTVQSGVIPANLKTALSKAEVIDDTEIKNVFDLLKSSEGKQQFYRGILKFFGMERGVEIYKAVRPEYTNLTKLVKQ
ncbi:MAG: hypothetical protein K2J73_04195 [Oscillospiraceae bacterium]|nr:hypothetical protein [Oscillospiraceae bacterium]